LPSSNHLVLIAFIIFIAGGGHPSHWQAGLLALLRMLLLLLLLVVQRLLKHCYHVFKS
jgi:hypothetical protein